MSKENTPNSTYYPVTIINNTNDEVNFHIFNPDSHDGFIHFDYGGRGSGYRTVGIPGNSQISGYAHVYVDNVASPILDFNYPGHFDISPDQSPGGTIILTPKTKFLDHGLEEEVPGNLIYFSNGYRGPYNFDLYFDEAGENPVPLFTETNLSQPLYFILSY